MQRLALNLKAKLQLITYCYCFDSQRICRPGCSCSSDMTSHVPRWDHCRLIDTIFLKSIACYWCYVIAAGDTTRLSPCPLSQTLQNNKTVFQKLKAIYRHQFTITSYHLSKSHRSYCTDIEIKSSVVTVWHSSQETFGALCCKSNISQAPSC